MTKQHLKAIIKHDLAEAIEGASHFGNNAEKVPIDFLIDKIADLQLQIEELRSLLNSGFPPKTNLDPDNFGPINSQPISPQNI